MGFRAKTSLATSGKQMLSNLTSCNQLQGATRVELSHCKGSSNQLQEELTVLELREANGANQLYNQVHAGA